MTGGAGCLASDSEGIGLEERGAADSSHDAELLLDTLLAEPVEVPVWPGVLWLWDSESVGVNDSPGVKEERGRGGCKKLRMSRNLVDNNRVSPIVIVFLG